MKWNQPIRYVNHTPVHKHLLYFRSRVDVSRLGLFVWKVQRWVRGMGTECVLVWMCVVLEGWALSVVLVCARECEVHH